MLIECRTYVVLLEITPRWLDEQLSRPELVKAARLVLLGERSEWAREVAAVRERGFRVPAGASPWEAKHR